MNSLLINEIKRSVEQKVFNTFLVIFCDAFLFLQLNVFCIMFCTLNITKYNYIRSLGL